VNIIDEKNAEGNQYLLLDKVIDWRKHDSTIVTRDDM
jgi:hypothetical protein